MKVSILIPVYNAELYLAATIRSALAQTWPDTEIIIVNDGSTDRSLEIANQFITANLKVFSQKNAGGSAARNRAFEESTGDYIQYLDADDLISADKIENQMRLLLEAGPDAIASCSWNRFIHESELSDEIRFNKDLDRDFDKPVEWLLNAWEGKGMATPAAWLVPRHIIEKAGRWDEGLLANQDGEFFSRVLLNAGSIKYSPKGQAFYRNGIPTSITGSKSVDKCYSYLLSFKLYEESILQIENSFRVRHALMCNYLNFMYYNYDVCRSCIAEAKASIQRLGFQRLEIWGHIRFKIFAMLVGFENALRLRSVLRRAMSS